MNSTSSISSKKNPYREQLDKLPEVFTLSETRRVLGYSTTTAHVTLSRWMKMGLVDALANRSGVYFNLEKNPAAREKHMQLAISKKYPVLRIVGPHVLANYGWTTQIQRYLNLVVNIAPVKSSTSSANGYLSVPEVDFSYRTKKWWMAALADREARDRNNTFIQGFESVSPGFALVDMWQRQEQGWFPDADDLYLDEAGTPEAIMHACQLLGVKPEPLFDAIKIQLPAVSTIQPSVELESIQSTDFSL